MSLIKTDLVKVLKMQYLFKFKANIDVFSSLIGIQLLAVLFSFGGFYHSTHGWGMVINLQQYSANIVICFTFIWALITAITITTKPYRHYDFTFVTNRLSSSLSNILFLLTVSVLGSITAMLSSNLIKFIVYMFLDDSIVLFKQPFFDFFTGMITTSLYTFLFCSIGYLVGAFIQYHKGFSVVIPVLFMGLLIFDGMTMNSTTITGFTEFYIKESNPFYFLLKTILMSSLVLTAAISIFNHLEVER
ncbi:hypothetical protein [Cytobacillus purgationiresistens]|uniref:ABC transporter permease n=1 Tax=Cytobacillus purgationiresistens TaxID=863449 RepID=A0ABU0AH10_9BACI|nr:hypothetical protein [Cytobacillus purgationiresistens]MDQ0270550.1 hypothetical protein [Cytobacillus purgationiresistens]